MNLVGGQDSDETQYFLQLALKGLLEKVLVWNDPRTLGNTCSAYYSVELDVLLMRIFQNLVNSDSNNQDETTNDTV